VPGRWQEAIIEDQLVTSTGVSSLPQFALAELLRSRAYLTHIAHIRLQAKQQAPRVRDLILQHFPEGTRVSQPQGGFLHWVECTGLEALCLTEKAHERGIAIAPGTLFSANGSLTHAFRLSSGLNLTPRIERAISELGKIANELVHKDLWLRGQSTRQPS
jgi:DNA-binding transcriptional MocR family regulator